MMIYPSDVSVCQYSERERLRSILSTGSLSDTLRDELTVKSKVVEVFLSL